MCGDLGEEPEDIRLVSPLVLVTGDLEGAACMLQCLLGTPQQQQGLSQICQQKRVAESRLRRVPLLDCLGQKRYLFVRALRPPIAVPVPPRHPCQLALPTPPAL